MLGPLLFILYINDLNKSLTMPKSIHFADINPSTNHPSLIKSNFAQVQIWIYANKLSQKIHKTNYVLNSNANQIEIINIWFCGQPIDRTSHLKFMGVFSDDKLKFHKHINNLCSKVSQSTGIMRRISYLVPADVLRNFHYILICSGFTYATTSLGSALNSTTVRLESLLSKEISLITD